MTTHFATTVYHIKKKIWKKKKNSNNAFDLSGFHQYCHCTANQPEIFRFSRIKLLRGYFYKLPFIFIHIRNSTDRKVQNSILRIFYKRACPSVTHTLTTHTSGIQLFTKKFTKCEKNLCQNANFLITFLSVRYSVCKCVYLIFNKFFCLSNFLNYFGPMDTLS